MHTRMAIQEDLFNISGNISGSPISYTAYGSSDTSFNSTVTMASCEESSGCPIGLPSSYCSQSTIINITISATNKLGEGPHSHPFIIGTCYVPAMHVIYESKWQRSCLSNKLNLMTRLTIHTKHSL